MRGRSLFYWTIKTIAWPVTRLYVRLGVEGLDRIPREGPCIVVANHASYADSVVLGSAFPRRIMFLITAPIYSMKRLKWFYYMMGAIPVAPEVADPGALKAALRALHRGGVVGIFPEGQRMAGGRIGSAKGGVALLASRSGAPVIPAAIVGARSVMPVGAMFPRPFKMKVRFGAPLTFPRTDGARASREQLDRFAVRVMTEVESLLHNGAASLPAGDDLRSAP